MATTCPQDFVIYGQSSNRFEVTFSSDAEKDLLIDAILSYLMDALGETFVVKIAIVSRLYTLDIKLPNNEWLVDIGKNMEVFQYSIGKSILKIHCVSILTHFVEKDWDYTLVAKNGVYI
jgi:hypothetical protein